MVVLVRMVTTHTMIWGSWRVAPSARKQITKSQCSCRGSLCNHIATIMSPSIDIWYSLIAEHLQCNHPFRQNATLFPQNHPDPNFYGEVQTTFRQFDTLPHFAGSVGRRDSSFSSADTFEFCRDVQFHFISWMYTFSQLWAPGNDDWRCPDPSASLGAPNRTLQVRAHFVLFSLHDQGAPSN
jgi:hypothetical protein